MPGCAWSSAASTLEKSPTIGVPPQSLQSTSGLQARGPSTPIKAARRQRDPAWRNPLQSTLGLQAHQTSKKGKRSCLEKTFFGSFLLLAAASQLPRCITGIDTICFQEFFVRSSINMYWWQIFIQPQYETHSHQPKLLPNNPNKIMLNMIPNDSR